MAVRDRLVELMRATLADEAQHGTWTYRAVRPLAVPASWQAGQKVTADCSKGTQYLCHWGAAPDPMGNGYGPYGNSSTIWANLQHMDLASECLPGDIITFGHNGDEHAAMVLEAGSDPLLWSMGHEGAPNSYRLSFDHREHQFLRLPVVYVPTPQERLRALTGWFAWMNWLDGTGDFRHSGPKNPNVRPNVKRRIPIGWWIRRRQFKARAKKAG